MEKIETVEIPKKVYDRLVESQEKLDALEAYGVDNWEGYSDAMSNLGDDERDVL